MKRILITILISAFCISMEAQKISALTEATVADDNSLIMTRVGNSGDLIRKISLGNVFKDRTLTGTITLPATTSIGTVSDTELSYLNNVTSAIQTQINGKLSVSDTSNMLAPYITDDEARKAINDSLIARLNGATEISDVAVMLADSTAGAGHYASHYDMTTGLAGKVAIADTANMLADYINKADTAAMLSNYAKMSDIADGGISLSAVQDEIADSLNALRPLVIGINDIKPYFVFGAGTGAAADSTLFAKGNKSFGSFRIIEDSLYVHSITNLYMTTGDSLKFNVYYGNGMTRTATDSLFTAPQGAGSYATQTLTPDNERTINHGQDVWVGIIGPQPANMRPKEWILQLNAKIVRD